MGGKLNIYNLGVSGVVVDKSPIHVIDGELLRAQNAQVDSVGALGGIRKRDGIAQLNPLILAGAVTGMLPLPLPDEGARVRRMYIPLESGSATWMRSADGLAWTGVTIPTRAATVTQSNMENGLTTLAAVQWKGFRNRLYFPGSDYEQGVTAPTLHMFDGTDDVLVGRISASPWDPALVPAKQITSIVPYSDHELLIAVADNNIGAGSSRVLLFNISTHKFSTVAPDTNLTDGWILGGLAVWQGRIWIGGYHANGGVAVNVYSARAVDKAWVAESPGAGTAHGYVTHIAVYRGELYVSFAADLNVNGNIYKRTAAGIWSMVYTSDGTAAGNSVGPMIVSQDGSTLFAYQNSISGGAAPQLRIIKTTNGTSWSLDYNISTALANTYGRSGMPYLDGTDGSILWPLGSGSGGATGGLLKRTAAGVWSVILAAISEMRGPLGIVRF